MHFGSPLEEPLFDKVGQDRAAAEAAVAALAGKVGRQFGLTLSTHF